ncbi:MAG: aspartyl protease family protein [Pirellulales bacterium]
MRFAYGRYEVEPTPSQPGAAIIYRPVIPIRVIGFGADAVFYGLLDTGADETLLTEEMAELVGMEVDASRTAIVTSASGEMSVSYGDVTLEVGRGRARYRWRTTAGVVKQPWREAILGHMGFLRYFDVTFFGETREVRLTRNAMPLPEPIGV